MNSVLVLSKFPAPKHQNPWRLHQSSILEDLAKAGKAFEMNEAGSREALIDQNRALVAALEISSEFLQRSFWADVSLTPIGPFFL